MRYNIIEITGDNLNVYSEVKSISDMMDFQFEISQRGSGSEINARNILSELLDEIEVLIDENDLTPNARRLKEYDLAFKLYYLIYEAEIPDYILADYDFWRYLSLEYFRLFIIWREGGAKKLPHMRAFGIEKRPNFYCVPHRMYVRASMINSFTRGIDYYRYPDHTDVWRSHILGITSGYSTEFSDLFLSKYIDEGMNSDQVRVFIKWLRVATANLYLPYLNYEDLQVIVDNEYQKWVNQIS